MGFLVKAKQCKTCIYFPASGFIVEDLEDQVRDQLGYFAGHRICHEGNNACCRGFWNKHKDEFPGGQIAQRLDAVKFVD